MPPERWGICGNPGYRLHKLRGSLTGRYAVDVSGN